MADTVIDPGTMVVHFEDTETTFSAMVCAHWLPGFFAFAFGTQVHL